jgi:hypothetical protein
MAKKEQTQEEVDRCIGGNEKTSYHKHVAALQATADARKAAKNPVPVPAENPDSPA